MASRTILVFVSIFIVLSGFFELVHGYPLENAKGKVIYRRYVRRRLIPFSNNYVDDVIEVFNSHRRPPPYAFLHEEDLTKFVRCDFDPSMPDCNNEGRDLVTTTLEPPRTSTTATSTTVRTDGIMATSSSSFWSDRKTEPAYTTPEITTTTDQTTSTIKNSEEASKDSKEDYKEIETNNENETNNVKENGTDNDNEKETGAEYDYDYGGDKDAQSKETDEPKAPEEYVENNDSEEEKETEINADEDTTESQTEKTTTKSSVFNWF